MKTQIKKESISVNCIYRRDMIFYLNLILSASEKAKDKNKYLGELNDVINTSKYMLDIIYNERNKDRVLTYSECDLLEHYADNLQVSIERRFDLKYFKSNGGRNNKLITIYDNQIKGHISWVQKILIPKLAFDL